MTSKHLAEFVAEVLQRFMHVDQFENYFETYGKLVATRVGEIRISVDGEPWKVLDIEASIRDLPRYNESWIQDILKLRAIFGLPIHVCDSGHSRTEA
jgi:HJR/Mrr/RecB family endonuclease